MNANGSVFSCNVFVTIWTIKCNHHKMPEIIFFFPVKSKDTYLWFQPGPKKVKKTS